MYEVEIKHEGLHKYRKIRGKDLYVVQQKAEMQKRQWDEQWQKLQAKQQEAKRRDDGLKYAEKATKEAQQAIQSIENTLAHTLTVDDKINWESLKNRKPFSENKPKEPILLSNPLEPKRTDLKYKVQFTLIEKLFKSRQKPKLEKASQDFDHDYSYWQIQVKSIEEENKKLMKQYEFETKMWEERKAKYIQEQEKNNATIDEFKASYFAADVQAIVEYNDIVLANSRYPETFPQEFEIEYIESTKTLVIEYQLPDLPDLPRLKEVKYIQSKKEFKETFITDAALNKLYDSLLYQIILRTIHEIFEADVINAVDNLILNGWVHTTDKRTGKEVNICIASIQTTKDVFNDINLGNVDPKECFKNLKGVASARINSLTPIAPILQISREDKRFVAANDIAETIDETINLASMDWQDFEHLIRELFDKEFNTHGGEVKITRASKDGGVDAIAFDPDPIRGGKIVIQAKRYTNPVGLSAVRDLYGTVMNEGANKGILVTTSDYGPDAYSFANDKPLTLLNGSNLLHLLEKHGHKAKIDLKEAKLTQNLNK